MNDAITDIVIGMLSPERLERIDHVLENRTSSLTILLDRIHHPHNIAAILRSADAFGIRSVHLIESSKNNDKSLDEKHISEAQKSPGISMGTEKWVEIVRHSSGREAIQSLKTEGFTIVTLNPPPINPPTDNLTSNGSSKDCISITELPFEKKLCLLFGSELEGVDPALEHEADISAYIPMYGFVESFNVSVACAITLFCSVIKKTSPERRTPPLSETEKGALRDKWIKQSIPRSKEVLANLEKRSERDIRS